MKGKVKDKAKIFFLGWLMSYAAVIFFAALGMVEIGGSFGETNHLITPVFVSLIVWVMIFLLGTLLRKLLLVGMFFVFVGSLFIVPLWSYVGLIVADYLLPAEWLVLEHANFVHFLAMGLVFLVIDSTVHKDHLR